MGLKVEITIVYTEFAELLVAFKLLEVLIRDLYCFNEMLIN